MAVTAKRGVVVRGLSPREQVEMPTNAERAATLIRALEAGVAGDSSIVSKLFTDDVCGRAPAVTISSAAELAVELEDRAAAFSDIEFAATPLDVAGDTAAIEWVLTLTHSGTLEVRGMLIEPTGARVCVHGLTVAEFEGDRIRSFRQYWDETEVLVQLGLANEDDENEDDEGEPR